ncbi:MAG TPA: heme-binding domain-containing protein [Thermoanaerobaculia bacterium]|nr:heme-binding domain-containing protein [Thermoanaerobaculia bacterium]
MKWLKRILLALVIIFALMQFVRPQLTNPPVDPARKLVAPPQVQTILDRSCRDCHSNETAWPWYSQVAPISWWLADHVKDGRRELNLSEFRSYSARKSNKKLEEICEQVKEAEMPLKSYLPLHPSAKLSDADRQTLCAWTDGLRAAARPGS